MLFLRNALRTKKARPAESFTDLVTGMFVVNYPCISSSITVTFLFLILTEKLAVYST